MMTNKKYQQSWFIILILLFLFLPINVSLADQPHWDESWSYGQMIDIPIDTSLENAKNQPIDISIQFDSLCWAKNEKHHSIRVLCWDGFQWYELESQIYNLETSSENYISQCNVIFLIPYFADGTEKYYIYYDDSEKPSTTYPTHIDYKESSYHYEPIPGYPLESKYFEIFDNGFINYMISYDGQFMGYNTAQHIYKMIDRTTEIKPKNAEIFASFDYKYAHGDGIFEYISTSQQFVSKEVINHGNLMIRIGIVTNSKLNDLKSTITYTYYHSPGDHNRIHVHVIHETLKDIEIYSQARTDGVYASIQAGGVQSISIEELNFGEILPWLHFNDEMNSISEYPLDTDPEHIRDDPDIRVISVQDNINLGEDPWISFDEGHSGKAHAIIFDSNDVVKHGNNEQNGIQINAFQMNFPHLPGLEHKIATVQAGRNSVQPGRSRELMIDKGFTVEFQAEFFSSNNGGFSTVEKEAALFRELAKIKPQTNNNFETESEPKEAYELSVFVYNAQSMPFGSTLSAGIGMDFPFITVEIFRENNVLYSQNALRLPLKAIDDIEDPSFLEQIGAISQIFDLRNTSFLKKSVFSGVEKGSYVIRVYRENPFISDDRRFIGYSLVELTEDKKINIFCRREASMDLLLMDQHGEYVKNANVLLQNNNQTILTSVTDETGLVTINAPVHPNEYTLTITYKSIIIHREPIKITVLNSIRPIEKSITFTRHILSLQLLDTWKQPIDVEVNPTLSIGDSGDFSALLPIEKDKGIYHFENLPASTYQLFLRFKKFTHDETIVLSDNKELLIEFPAEFNITLNILDERGHSIDGTEVIIKKNNKEKIITDFFSDSTISLPPSEYNINIFYKDQLIGARSISAQNDKTYDIVTNHRPLYPFILSIIGLLFIFSLFFYMIYAGHRKFFFISLVIILICISFFLPWWEIQGSTNNVETMTRLFFTPHTLITRYTTETIITGETSYLPPEFQTTVNIIILFTVAIMILIMLNSFFEWKNFYPERYQRTLSLLSMILLFIGLIGFFIALYQLAHVGVGSILGSGKIDFRIPGENIMYSVFSQWAPGSGFNLFVFSTILYAIITIYYNFVKKEGY